MKCTDNVRCEKSMYDVQCLLYDVKDEGYDLCGSFFVRLSFNAGGACSLRALS
jgi:hypothetical protein